MCLLRVEAEGGVKLRELSFAELAALPGQVVVFRGSEAGGVRLGALLDAIDLPADAAYVTIIAADGCSKSLPIATIDEVVLLYRSGADPLPAELGGPLRVLVPALDECASLKSVSSIALSAEPVKEVRPGCTHIRAA